MRASIATNPLWLSPWLAALLALPPPVDLSPEFAPDNFVNSHMSAVNLSAGDAVRQLTGGGHLVHDVMQPGDLGRDPRVRHFRTAHECMGTDSGLSRVQGRDGLIQRLEMVFMNCSRVLGNVEIVGVTAQDLKHRNVSDVDYIFEHLEEVTGYVLIYGTELPQLSLPRLRLVYGEQRYSHYGYTGSFGLAVFSNTRMRVLDMRSLRRVGAGSVLAAMNPYLCHLSTIDWEQIVYPDTQSRLQYFERTDMYLQQLRRADGTKGVDRNVSDPEFVQRSSAQCDADARQCHPDCSGRCWGPSSSMCQTIYRGSACAPQCTDQTCWRPANSSSAASAGAAPSSLHCCSSSCFAGCSNSSLAGCHGCRRLNDNGRCVDACPKMEEYDPGTGMFQHNPKGKYQHKRYCVSECPAGTLVDTVRSACVTRCPRGSYAFDGRRCRPCATGPDDVSAAKPCPKTCRLADGEALTGDNIGSLQNCTRIEGAILILGVNFQDRADIREGGKIVQQKGLNESALHAALSNVRIVSDYVFVQGANKLWQPKDMSFLKNLETIDGVKLMGQKYALEMSHMPLLHELRLDSLREIHRGSVFIGRNSELCYVDTILWDEIVRDPDADVILSLNGDGTPACERADPVTGQVQQLGCSALCNQTAGCWGGGPAACRSCDVMQRDAQCADSCPQQGYYISSPGVCNRCDPECVVCVGPSPRNCTRCAHLSLDGECVPRCPLGWCHSRTLWANDTVCSRCHQGCSPDAGCTGPLPSLGQGGCRKCRHAVINDDGQTLTCLSLPEPQFSCEAAGLRGYYRSVLANHEQLDPALVDDGMVCNKCHEQCSSCRSYGVSPTDHGCKCRHVVLRQRDRSEQCAAACADRSAYYNTSERHDKALVPVCARCHAQCVGCTAAGPENCVKCVAKAHYFDEKDLSKFRCVPKCPVGSHEYEEGCYLENVASQMARKATTEKAVTAGAIVLLAVVVLVALLGLVAYRRRWYLTKKLYETPYDEPAAAADCAKPNMNQLRIIPLDELSKGQMIGTGAFGTVYMGMFKSKRERLSMAVAIKELKQGAMQCNAEQMLDEASIMASMSHPHLVRLVGVCVSHQLLLVSPYMLLGCLTGFMRKHRYRIGSRSILLWSKQIASGMEYLERERMVHRDLAARNILVQHNQHVRVSDFGLSKVLNYGKDEVISGGALPIRWLAPECIKWRRFTTKSDVWAFGVTMWEMLHFCDAEPYGRGTPLGQIGAMIDRGVRLPQPPTATLQMYQLLVQCWLVDPKSRPSFSELRCKLDEWLSEPWRYVCVRDANANANAATTPVETFTRRGDNNNEERDLPPCSGDDEERRNVAAAVGADVDDVTLPQEYYGTDESGVPVVRVRQSTGSNPASPSRPLLRFVDGLDSAGGAAAPLRAGGQHCTAGTPTSGGRHVSVASARYQSEPWQKVWPNQAQGAEPATGDADGPLWMSASARPAASVTTDADNYLVPDSQRSGSPSRAESVYTPVIGHQNQYNAELSAPPSYYNDLDKPAATKPVENALYLGAISDKQIVTGDNQKTVTSSETVL